MPRSGGSIETTQIGMLENPHLLTATQAEQLEDCYRVVEVDPLSDNNIKSGSAR